MNDYIAIPAGTVCHYRTPIDYPAALEKLKAAELAVLLDVAGFCDTWDIPWIIHSGTALGAARHGGFIPWDDDIDIGMRRQDYERFIATAETSEAFQKTLKLTTAANDPHQAALFAKVSRRNTAFITAESSEAGDHQGIGIDVFPFDVAAEGPLLRRQRSNARRWQSISYLRHATSINGLHQGILGACERMAIALAHPLLKTFISQQEVIRRFRRSIVTETPLKGCSWVSLCYPGKVFPDEVLFPPKPVEFEGVELPGPADIEAYLTLEFGDWQTLPPIEDRKTHKPLFIGFADGGYYKAADDDDPTLRRTTEIPDTQS